MAGSPDAEAAALYVVDGLVTYQHQAGAGTVAEGWIVPGARRPPRSA